MTMNDPSDFPEDEPILPVSARIRARILQARKRFNANDNISAFVKPGELAALLEEVASKMNEVLAESGD